MTHQSKFKNENSKIQSPMPVDKKENVPQPQFRTPADQLNDNEKIKLASGFARGHLYEDFRDGARTDVQEETETLAKSHGIYLEYNRAKTGREKDWMYMIRITVPGGGAFNRKQWQILDDLSQRTTTNNEGKPSLKLTTRQNIQFHWIKKSELLEVVRTIATTGFFTMNGCGDNVRNITACPLSRFSNICNVHALAHKYVRYFRLEEAPHLQIFEIDTSLMRDENGQERKEKFEYAPNLLNRKFKFGFSTVHRDPITGEIERDNCIEVRTNDSGIVPIIENEQVVAWQLFIGGGMGEKNGKPTFAAHSQPLGIVRLDNLQTAMDAIVKVHQEWGDRKNRHWARLKYVVQAMGTEWYREQVNALGAEVEKPDLELDPGPRKLHHGWHTQESNGKLAYGIYIESGRLIDREHEQLKTMARTVMEKFDVEAMTTVNQDLLFVNVDPAAKQDLEATVKSFGHGYRNGRKHSPLRVLSGSCVGLPTCRLSYTDSERFEPELLGKMEELGYGEINESIGITGCERQCFRPATKTIGWVGQGPDLYMLKVGGAEDARTIGSSLIVDEKLYLRQVSREQVPVVTAALFDFYQQARLNAKETMGAFHRRVGKRAILEFLKSDPRTAGLCEKTYPAPYLPPEQQW